MSVTFIHFEIEPATLQPHVPFALDVRDGKAYVSLVAFSQQKLRLAWGGPVTAWAGALVANHDFLNVRTYLPGGAIHFIAEWVPSRLALWVAPKLYGLPYRLGRFGDGMVSDATGKFAYRVETPGRLRPCEPGSLDEFLLERYVAFTKKCRFRVAHQPWPQSRVEAEVREEGLLGRAFDWWRDARYVGANFSPGVPVAIGAPERLVRLGSLTRRWAYF